MTQKSNKILPVAKAGTIWAKQTNKQVSKMVLHYNTKYKISKYPLI